MTTPRSSLPVWATSTTVASGHADTGLTTRLEPSADQKAAGHIGGTATAARVENWRAGSVGDWISYLAPIQLRNWVKRNSYEVTSTTPGSSNFVNPMASHSGKGWVIPGLKGTYPAVYLAPGALTEPGKNNVTAFRSPATTVGTTYGVSTACSDQGIIVTGILTTSETDTRIWRLDTNYSIGTGSWVTLSASAGNAGKIVCSKSTGANGRFVAFDARANGWSNTKKVYYSDNGGTTWSAQTLSGWTGSKTISCVVAADGYVAVGMINSNSVMIASASSLTWTETLLPSSRTTVGLARGASCWFALTQSSELYRMADGSSTWSLVAMLPDGVPWPTDAFTGGVFEGNYLACDGSRALVAPFVVTKFGHGICWSIDEGVTWHTEWLAQSWTDAVFEYPQPRGVAYADGEFLYLVRENDASASALPKDVVYTSLKL